MRSHWRSVLLTVRPCEPTWLYLFSVEKFAFVSLSLGFADILRSWNSCRVTCLINYFRTPVYLHDLLPPVPTSKLTLSPNSACSSRHVSTRSTCRAHAFWLSRACRTARLDTLYTTRSTGSTRSTRRTWRVKWNLGFTENASVLSHACL